ncbi:hypothetical protein [Microbispora bryophytorum]|uniref:Uncharacterized protein n=1 Tax=Microbispora bryophytorum TaxID=1460882 RepID=A0A8H9GSY1_9ACTN|nr:hypothetical protein [Microbispora bryophytorum]MBD3135378.1 hypothetical protein [Microbispora bryophytorum]TQS09579.1 hypothetical protein FLX07_00380 [Microbispora bryophytorum]GGN97341.1 hypothetical protein GCM10011574_00780 [Microbispora bryophytorum]
MIGFEWALEGKRPGSYDEYGLLEWSDGRLDREVFDKLRHRYTASTAGDLPQVTIGTARISENGQISYYLVLAIRQWSGHRDFANRKIAYTRWFYVPYEQLVDRPVSYTALYTAFAALPLEPRPPLTVTVPPYDPGVMAPGPDTFSAAALLLNGRPVCVVGADTVPMIDRLRFADTVAALLPYGTRTRFTAATWTSSTSEHSIKLSFARYAPEGAQTVVWGRAADSVLDQTPSKLCHQFYTRSDVPAAEMIARLARQTEPLSIEKDRPKVLQLVELSGSAAPEPEPEPDRSPPAAPPALPTGSTEPTVAYRNRAGSPLTEALADALPYAADVSAAVEDLVRSVTNPTALQRVLLKRNCFRSVIDPRSDATRLYARLVDAAFPAEEMRRQASQDVADALICSTATPDAVRHRLAALMGTPAVEPRRTWWPPGRRVRLALILTGTAALVAVAVVAVFLTLGDAGETPQESLSPPPLAVVVQAPADQRYAAEAFAERLRRDGYAPSVETIDPTSVTPPVGKPAVTVAYDLDVLESVSGGRHSGKDVREGLQERGLSELADLRVTSTDVLLVRDGVKPQRFLDDPGEGDDILIRDTIGGEQLRALTDHGLRLVTVPARDISRRLAEGSADAAIVPESVSAFEGYQRPAPRDLPLAQRRLVVLVNREADEPMRQDLLQVAGATDLGHAPEGDPILAAKALVDRIAPVGEPTSIEEPEGTDSFPYVLFFVVVALAFVAVVLLMWRPARLGGTISRHRR